MKYFIKLVFLFIVVLVASCSSDTDCNGLGFVNLENNSNQTLVVYVNSDKVTLKSKESFSRYPYKAGFVEVTAFGLLGTEKIASFVLNECSTKTVIIN